MPDSSDSKELEIRIKEYETLPANMLGLTSWLLRNVPENRRVEFLDGFEKLIRVNFYPDHAKNPQDRAIWEKYIQSVANAVSLLRKDPLAYELSIEQVPSSQNPVSRLQRVATQDKKRLSELEETVVNLRRERIDWVHLREDLVKIAEYNRELRGGDLENRKYFYVYDIPQEHEYILSGRKINFERKRGLNGLRHSLFVKLLLGDLKERNKDLRNILATYSPEKNHRDFVNEVEDALFDASKETIRFSGKMSEDGEVQIIGGFPLVSMREFMKYHLISDDFKVIILHQEDFRKYVRSLTPRIDKEAPLYKTLLEKVSPFVTPYIILGNPLLITRDKGQDASFELFYVEGIKPHYLGGK